MVLVVLTTLLLAVGGLFVFGDVTFKPEVPEEALKNKFPIKHVKTEVHGIKILNQSPRYVELEVDYSFNGRHGPGIIQVVPISEHNPKREYQHIFGLDEEVEVFQGERSVKVIAKREDDVSTPYTTTGFEVQIAMGQGTQPIYKKEFQQAVSWPAYDRASDPYFLNKERRVLYNLAVDAIDKEGNLRKAGYYLQRIIVATPDFAPAHYQMGRSFMKSSNSEKALKLVAESAMTAIALDPDFADAYILFAHVLLHQEKYKESAEQFAKAEAKGTENLWLYSRWGEMHKAKNETQSAIKKFEKVVEMPLSSTNNDDAIKYAYSELIGIYDELKQWSDMERLYKARIDKFPKNGCYKAHYANYLIDHLKELDNAELMATDARDATCRDRSFTTPILAKLLYLRWSMLDPSSREGLIAYSRAKAISPVDARLFYKLASSEKLIKVIKALMDKGSDIDMVDDDGMTALIRAIQDNNANAAKNLLIAGADVNKPIETRRAGRWSVLMAATAMGDASMIKLLLKHGADPNFKNKDGMSAADIAKELGKNKLYKLLVAHNA